MEYLVEKLLFIEQGGMNPMDKPELNQQLESAYQQGILHGIKLMENRMLLACENGTPIAIRNRAYFIKSDLQHLVHDIFADLEANVECN